jgi:cysteine-rich repeat protein
MLQAAHSTSRHHMLRRSTAAASLIGVLVALCAAPAPLHAHGMPAALEFWGAFGRRVARCQRLISRNAAVCALQAWEVRSACRLAALHGRECDADATERAVEAARLAAVDRVGAACTDQQAQTLLFLDKREAQLDVVTFCRELEDAVESAVFRPLPETGGVPPHIGRCIESASVAATKLLRQGFDGRQRVLDRIAMLSFSPSSKLARVAASTAAIAREADGIALTLSTACPTSAFAETYGRDAAPFLATVASRADCLCGQTYAQGGIVCPPPQCGNGMVEVRPIQNREDCDDGNVVSGDGCSASCTRE